VLAKAVVALAFAAHSLEPGLAEVGGVLEVPAGAEGVARAGDDEDESIVVVAEPPPRVVELVVLSRLTALRCSGRS
jgi:hypothetical protein